MSQLQREILIVAVMVSLAFGIAYGVTRLVMGVMG